MPETLLSSSSVKLFGRVLTGLTWTKPVGTSLSAQGFLKKALDAATAQLAMIYGYSYQGQYQALLQPALFLVHGPGNAAVPPTGLDDSGVARDSDQFAGDIFYWEYDRADFSLRLDIDSGPLERILLEAEQQDGGMPYFRGAHTDFRGAHTRFRGAHTRLRSSGE
jgi:hypothetical protein